MVASNFVLELDKITQAIQDIKHIVADHGSTGGESAKVQAVLKTLKGQDQQGLALLCANVATALEAYFNDKQVQPLARGTNLAKGPTTLIAPSTRSSEEPLPLH
jgi:hypothetical protein